MNIIKEHCQANNRCVIRTNCYGSSLKHIMQLVSIAKIDFPPLKDEDIVIV